MKHSNQIKNDFCLTFYFQKPLLWLSGINFINIYDRIFCQYPFTKKSQSETFQLCNFWRQNIGKKWACKMLMKLTQALCRGQLSTVT